MNKTFLFGLILSIVGVVAVVKANSAFNQNHTYTIASGECNYFLLDQESNKQYYISGETTTDIEQFLDKSVKVAGKVIQTTGTPDPAAKIYYNDAKIKNGECKVNPGIDIAAVKIDDIHLAD